jgi:hypothetical protein
MRAPALLVVVAALSMAAVACGSSSTSSSSPSTADGAAAPATGASSSPAQPAASGCNGYSAGSGGVVQVFCSGTSKASVTVGAKSKQLTGGSCAHQDGQLAVNFGVVTGPDFPSGSAKPDYIGALIADGSTTAGAFTVHIDGAGGIVVHGTATVNGTQSAMLRGTLLAGDAVSVDVTC